MTRYEQGFMNKCAEYGVDGAELAAYMQKQALSMGRLAARLHPKVDPDKLNWFTRLFTKTKNMPTRIRQSGEEMAKLVGEAGPYGSSPASTGTYARGMRSVTRISPERILAALGIIGGTGAATKGLLSGGAPGLPAEAVSTSVGKGVGGKSLAVLAALAGLGGAAAGTGMVVKKKGKKNTKKDDEDE